MKLFFFLFYLLVSTGLYAQSGRFNFTRPKMGSPFNLIFYANDSSKANALAEQSFTLVDSLNTIFSDYMAESELSKLSATAGSGNFVPVSPLLYTILSQSKEAWLQSSGTFDITIGPLSKLWRRYRKEKIFPPEEEIKAALSKVGFDKLIIDTLHKKVKLTVRGMQLDAGGIVKGFAAQQVVDFLKTNGIMAALADAGGDIVCSNAPPGKKSWQIGVNKPEQADVLLQNTMELHNKAVATSGDVYQFIEHKGKKYSHIINPFTGYGVTFQRNVTIVASDGATADWLATACSILPIAKAKKLVKIYGADLLITEIKNGKMVSFSTPGLKNYWK